VDSLNFVCSGTNGTNGTDGFNTIIRRTAVTAIESGGVCKLGGFQIAWGLDDGLPEIPDDGDGNPATGARDNVLQTGEVDGSYFDCDAGAGQSEGTVTPVALTLPADRFSSVGAGGFSQYQFTVPTSVDYIITLSQVESDLSWQLSGGDLKTPVICDNSVQDVAERCSGALAAGTYTLRVDEWDNIPNLFMLTVLTSQGVGGKPFTVAAVPFTGSVGGVAPSFYGVEAPKTATGTVGIVMMSNLTGDVGPRVFTSDAFSEVDTNWTCSTNRGTTFKMCAATVPVASGATLFIKAENFTFGAGATFTLNVELPRVAQGVAEDPFLITAVPFNGSVSGTANSFYRFVTTETSRTITLSDMTGNVDPEVYSDAIFTLVDTNWTCTKNTTSGGVLVPDTCTAKTPVPAATALFIKAVGIAHPFFLPGATFILDVGP
jgi:hypothetical protein